MSHQVCKDVGNWVNNNIQQQVENCIEMPCNWFCLCCNKWFCALVWVVVVVTTWVITTVCEIVADVVELVVTVVIGFVDVFVGIFTGDRTRILAGFGEIIGAFVVFTLQQIPIVTGGTLVGAFVDAGNAWALRNFAKGLINTRFRDNPETLNAVTAALGLNGGGFGLRLTCTVMRSSLRSDFSSPQNGGIPDLITFLADPTLRLDLKMLAGINPSAWWSRDWPQLVPDSGSITGADLDAYVASGGRGPGVKHFTLFSMSVSDVMSRTDCATMHANELGLVLKWNIIDTQLLAGNEIIVPIDSTFMDVLQQPPFMRNRNNGTAVAELCNPLAIAAFSVPPGFFGISANMSASTCIEPDPSGNSNFPGTGITGAAFRYCKPDLAFKYTLIHEIGHTFGLCHADGLLRIMFTMASVAGKKIFSWSSLFQYWTNGTEAGFILDEGKKVWEYIVMNFGTNCLKTRQF